MFLRAAAQRRGALVAGPHGVEHSPSRGETHACSTQRRKPPFTSAGISRYRDAPSRETGEVDKRASRAGEASTADARADLAVASRVSGDKKVGENVNLQF